MLEMLQEQEIWSMRLKVETSWKKKDPFAALGLIFLLIMLLAAMPGCRDMKDHEKWW